MHNIKVGDRVKCRKSGLDYQVIAVGELLAIVKTDSGKEFCEYITYLIPIPKIEREHWISAYKSHYAVGSVYQSKHDMLENRKEGEGSALHVWKTSDGVWHIEELPVDKT